MRSKAKQPQLPEEDEESSENDEISNEDESEEESDEGGDASDDSDEVLPQCNLTSLNTFLFKIRFIQDQSDDEGDDEEKLRASLADIPFEVLQVLFL